MGMARTTQAQRKASDCAMVSRVKQNPCQKDVMAKHREDTAQSNGRFVFSPKRQAIVTSTVRSLKIETPEGVVNIGREKAESGTLVGPDGEYRWQMSRRIPLLDLSVCTDVAGLQSAIGQLAEDIRNFDSAQEVVWVKKDGTELTAPRVIAMAETQKGEAIDAVAFIASCLNDALTLATQKKLYKRQASQAEATLRDELALAKPVGKVRKTKEVTDEEENFAG